eukprot:1161515-Pelagomonas_calceolata.AAC.1
MEYILAVGCSLQHSSLHGLRNNKFCACLAADVWGKLGTMKLGWDEGSAFSCVLSSAIENPRTALYADL